MIVCTFANFKISQGSFRTFFVIPGYCCICRIIEIIRAVFRSIDKPLLQNIGNFTLDLERLLCENTCYLDPENYESCPNNHSGDISIFGDREFQQKIKNLDDELEKYPEFIINKSFNSKILKEVSCIQKDSEALIEMNRLLKIILSMITVKKDFLKEFIEKSSKAIPVKTNSSNLILPFSYGAQSL